MHHRTFLFLVLLAFSAAAIEVTEDLEVNGNVAQITVSSEDGAPITNFSLNATGRNIAGPAGLLQEGFGSISYYAPNRRLNPKLEVLEEFTDRPVARYSYECDGPNIRGLRVTRQMEPMQDAASLIVTWTVANVGDERHWVAPWVRNDIMPGGSATKADRLDIPSLGGIVQPTRPRYYPASRNWYAATDPETKETVFAVFNAEHTHSFLAAPHPDGNALGVQTAFVPRELSPGESWTTSYRLNMVRGLEHIDFATNELAVQIDYDKGTLTALMAAPAGLPGLRINARVLAANDRVWKLPAKKFDIAPGKLVRATYKWTAPADGRYDFLAELVQDGRTLPLGADNGSPHGGIDTQFVVGKPGEGTMEAWTNAPYALDAPGRNLDRPLLHRGVATLWQESSLNKIFQKDTVTPMGTPDPRVRIALARNEHESFQIVIRPDTKNALNGVRFVWGDLVHAESGVAIPAAMLQAFRVGYVPVRIPSHYEGPTGNFPDPLPPLEPFTAAGGESSPVWFTLYAGEGLPAGIYRGMLEMQAVGEDPVEIALEVEVFGFTLPDTPALKTDFGYDRESALRGAATRTGRPNPRAVDAAYLDDALKHRVTLRELTAFPPASGNYAADLQAFAPKLDALARRGATTFALPADLLRSPDALAAANDFVRTRDLGNRAFVQIADEPPAPIFTRLAEEVRQWSTAAPYIATMATTRGLQPFLEPELDRWTIHTQLFDTVNGENVLGQIAQGREVWWYVGHTPPRPYANFFVDFTGVEHRVLFWQAFALGIRGLHYWSANYAPADQDPWNDVLDFTPVNGDGLLVYPSPSGPVSSIRWEIIRDGIEDFDYLAILGRRLRQLAERDPNAPLLQEAKRVLDLEPVVPNLVSFPRDPQILLGKRTAAARMIEKLDAALH